MLTGLYVSNLGDGQTDGTKTLISLKTTLLTGLGGKLVDILTPDGLIVLAR